MVHRLHQNSLKVLFLIILSKVGEGDSRLMNLLTSRAWKQNFITKLENQLFKLKKICVDYAKNLVSSGRPKPNFAPYNNKSLRVSGRSIN